ncbi:MAG: organic solvent tolerance protein OstA, partial [Planctomycetota bacterium]
MAESRGNVVRLRGVPVFYWPTIATNLEEPTFYVDRIRIGTDGVFGNQLMADWDLYELFGISEAPAGTDWLLSTDYLSDRGFGYGTTLEYDRRELFGFDGPARGLLDYWAIRDGGLDNVGLGRRTLVPEERYRFYLSGHHRQRLANGWEVTGESGYVSDRTFLEQYFEQQWDQRKSPRTGLRAKRLADNRELSIEANGRVNNFFSETQWLPRADHYWLGGSFLGDRLTWYSHSQAAYASLKNSFPPSDPEYRWAQLPWEVGAGQKGERLATRHEIDFPLQLGALKVVPFGLGELAQWGEALDGDRLQRGYVNAGVRTSLPMWATFPNVQDALFNLNGLAHKVVFDATFSYADANRNYDELPLYDPLDDTNIVEFRRRLFNPTLDPTITDLKFDPRTYAIRSGLQG